MLATRAGRAAEWRAWISEPLPQQTRVQTQPRRHRGSQPKVGLPDFTVEAGDTELSDAVAMLVDVLWADLDFEREYLHDPAQGVGVDSRRGRAPIAAVRPVDEKLGAEFVILGSVTKLAGNLDIEFRFISVREDSPGAEKFSWHYGGTGCAIKNARFCAHSIADDFHKKTRNLDGVARTKLAFSSDRDASRMTGRQIQNSGQGKEIYICGLRRREPAARHGESQSEHHAGVVA